MLFVDAVCVVADLAGSWLVVNFCVRCANRCCIRDDTATIVPASSVVSVAPFAVICDMRIEFHGFLSP